MHAGSRTGGSSGRSWLYVPGGSGACALLLPERKEELGKRLAALEETAGWLAERLERRDAPPGTMNGLEAFAYDFLPAAPLDFAPAGWQTASGEPFDPWKPQLIGDAEARGLFGLRPADAGADPAGAQRILNGRMLAMEMHSGDGCWICTGIPVQELRAALKPALQAPA